MRDMYMSRKSSGGPMTVDDPDMLNASIITWVCCCMAYLAFYIFGSISVRCNINNFLATIPDFLLKFMSNSCLY